MMRQFTNGQAMLFPNFIQVQIIKYYIFLREKHKGYVFQYSSTLKNKEWQKHMFVERKNMRNSRNKKDFGHLCQLKACP